jgi:CRISPR-associated protein Csm1
MSVQILLLGRLIGADEFLLAPAAAEPERTLLGRASWLNLLAEVLPRALLAELGLAKILLGTSGGDQFLLLLPEEARAQADAFLEAAASAIAAMTGGRVSLVWAVTEYLGDWTILRKRLADEMQRKLGAMAANGNAELFAPFVPAQQDDAYFATPALALRDQDSIGWNPEYPAVIVPGSGKHTWQIGPGLEAIAMARHLARTDDGAALAAASELAQRAGGKPVWGVLRGDVDDFLIRVRRLQSIEEHIQLSIMYKQFFAGELEVLCSMKDFWRKVSVMYSGGDDFAVFGSWDALLPLARELRRMFHRFNEENLRDFPGAEGKTLTMAIALAPDPEASLSSVYAQAGHHLDIAKGADKDCIYALGRVLEWKQLADASELKDALLRMVDDYGVSPDYIQELCGIYRETQTGSRRQSRPERPWRFHRRLNRVLPATRDREQQKARTALIADLAGKNPAHVKLRPGGRVALEWARLSTEEEGTGNA